MTVLRLFRVGTEEVTEFELRGKCEYCSAAIKRRYGSYDAAVLLIGLIVCDQCLEAGLVPPAPIQPLFPRINFD